AGHESLLRSRLRAAAWIILLPVALLFGHALWVDGPIGSWLHALVLTVVIGAWVILHGPRPLSFHQLRLIEVCLFGVLGAFFLSIEKAWFIHALRHQNDVQIMSVAGMSTVGFAVVMLAYGMFMPNGWTRTACMMIPPTLAPICELIFVRSLDPFAADVLTPVVVLQFAAVLVATAGISTFGTATIARLREEIRKAQRLGQYHLKQKIGHGGMGDVYLAEHDLLKRPCALKLIRPNQINDPLALQRFEKEVCSMARLSHANTVDVYDYGHTADGTFYYVMEYLPGLNLQDLVDRFGPMPPERVIHFLTQACAALAEAHRLGMVHRDLKPANLFAAERGGEYDFTKLLDFGLVVEDARADWVTQSSFQTAPPLAGSPLFMSPEQSRAEVGLDARSDIYSLGSTAYYLLTGRPPFEGKTPMRVMLAHAESPVVPPSAVMPVPFDLEQIILRCLQKQPVDRYDSVDDLRHALQFCQDAGLWTTERAALWWAQCAPEIMTEPLCDGHYCGGEEPSRVSSPTS
ncbi:MAG TPA: serine/threonine-protein kinase, partial [Planctomycetaceae bacterium]|nr:serine/threonine-protein kinase [Planctomycetaceae bacterium]